MLLKEVKSTVLVTAPFVVLCAAALTAQTPTHELRLTPEHVHWGYYDGRLAPVLHVASGDRVRVETMVAGGLQRLRLAGATEAEIPESLKLVEQRVTERGPGAHPMTGPIYIDGAQPGTRSKSTSSPSSSCTTSGSTRSAPAAASCPMSFRTRASSCCAGRLAPTASSSRRASRCRWRRSSDRSAWRRRRWPAGSPAGRPAGTAAIWTTRI